MIQSKFSIEAIVLGRNDEYEPNWSERLVASIAYNRSCFEGSAVDYRVAFVEWNPPRDKPLIAPGLVERFPFVRGIVVDADVHDALCTSPNLKMMLNFAYNCGLRTSISNYCMIFGGDLFFGGPLASYIKRVGLARNCLYRAERVNIRPDLDFARVTPAIVEDVANTISVNTCTEPPYDVPPYTHACGDFLLTDRLTMLGLRGFDESIRFARLHLDSRFCRTAMAAGLNCNLIGQIFHINHSNSYTVLLNDYQDTKYDSESNLPYLNPRDWGLADHTWSKRGDHYWYVSKPSGEDRSTIPEQFSEAEIDAINAVTRRIIAHKRAQHPDKPDRDTQMLGPASLYALVAEPDWIGAKVIHGAPTVVETMTAPWGFSALLRLAPLRQMHRRDSGFLFWEVEAEVLAGDVGIGLINHDHLSHEKFLTVAQGHQKIYLPATTIDADLMVRNGQNNGASRVAIYGVFLVHRKPLDLNESDLLLTAG